MENAFKIFINKQDETKIEELIAKLENEADRELEEIIIHLTSLIF